MPTNKFIIRGGKKLRGAIDVKGSKNAALPILAATLLTSGKCRISNIPRVSDVSGMLELMKEIGSEIKWVGEDSLEIENKNITLSKIKGDAVKKMRASILLVGPLLARFGKVENMQYPGGCSIGQRPIDVHLNAFKDLGAKIKNGKNSFSIYLDSKDVLSKDVVLEEFSVTATENILMYLSGIDKDVRIKIAAAEPHVQDLAKFLKKMGANISGEGTSTICVKGLSAPKGARHNVVSDYIEAGTFVLMGLSVGGDIIIKNAPIDDLDFVIKKLTAAGAKISLDRKNSTISVKSAYPGSGTKSRMAIAKIQTLPHPGIPTDLQSAFAVLATQAKGDTLIHEPMYEKRLEQLLELVKMGANVDLLDPHRAVIAGPVKLTGAEVAGNDLRGGAALVIAALSARGKSTISGVEYIERGYENLVERLRGIGADIEKI
ncbi:MAG: UDP-N-acetylglucosamine 1-carboxyvinyltransferase [Candidatus Magasanikbacteria bacterium RIFCSPHIGHO2_01_FULL_47_8]|uniref:UDP-N-acetylglucosamine 1-carboxyvinyltransferase n=1 Tax=Candidatus Magasanikbacteria bacterium RIFCSPHIGHO2_01_FULL_47_8 TaxID=1798673 RepID=A0A1F6MBB9_9BACT|nr:MAG: UDP-N-acetylglucosamine 1-carboxyvinyltransferase [Candidatus Magasanikbacteria bacterium RIFCSPHIGHO2_01_FULL_47_8]